MLLTHGDLLCTDDTRYMTLRAELRSPAWQRDFLAKPLAERRQIASDLRQLSATEIATQERLHHGRQSGGRRTHDARAHGVTLLLHGHTHRPAVHRFDLDGQPAARIVLGAWYEQASIVRWTAAGFALETLRLDAGQLRGACRSSAASNSPADWYRSKRSTASSRSSSGWKCVSARLKRGRGA